MKMRRPLLRPNLTLAWALALTLAACGDDGGGARPAADADASGLDAPTADMSKPDAEGPDAEGPDAEGPNAEGPDAEGPDAEGPDAEGPDAEGPDAEGPDAEGPDAEGPDAEGPDAEGPDAEGPDAEGPDAEGPDAEGPDAEGPDAEGPDAEEPDTSEPDATQPDASEPSDASEPGPDVVVDPCPPGACIPGTPTCPSLASVATCVEGPLGCGTWPVASPCPGNHVCHHGVCAACIDAYGDDAGLPEEVAINGLTCVGVAFGTGPKTFSPTAPVTRAEGIGWLVGGMQWEVICPFVPTFTDLGASPWACDVETAAAHGVLSPDADGKAWPDAPLTRADLAVYALRAVDLPAEPLGDNPFSDTVGHPAEPAITLAVELGLIAPLTETTFGPDEPASRAAAAFAVWEIAR